MRMHSGISRSLLAIAGAAAVATGVATASQVASPHGARVARARSAHIRIARDNGPRLHGAASRVWRRYNASGSSSRSSQANLVRLNSRFALFRRSGRQARVAAASSNVPPSISDPEGYGLVASERSYVALTSSSGVWVTPGTGGACLDWVNQDASTPPASSGVCNSNPSAVAAGGLFALIPAGESGTSTALFVGLVPDGTHDVTVKLPDGTSATATLHGNLFSVGEPASVKSTDLPFKRLTITSTTGQQTSW